MDIAKHQQSLMNIRAKYANICANITQNTKLTQKTSLKYQKDNEISFRTPVKPSKAEESVTSKNLLFKDYLQIAHNIRGESDKKQKKQFVSNIRLNLIGRRQSFSDNKNLQDIISQRQKQLTQRTQRNKQLLSKSKEVRENEIKHSIEKGYSSVKIEDKGIDLNHLKQLLKDKHNISNNKSHIKQISTNLQTHKNQNLYDNVKNNFTDKIKQNLLQTCIPKREKRTRQKQNNKIDTKPIQKKQEQYKQYSIKTPIPPPKESSPSKISSIFENTKKIQERIHALLSR